MLYNFRYFECQLTSDNISIILHENLLYLVILLDFTIRPRKMNSTGRPWILSLALNHKQREWLKEGHERPVLHINSTFNILTDFSLFTTSSLQWPFQPFAVFEAKDRIFIITNWVSPKFFLSYFVYDWVEVQTNQNEDAKSKQMSKWKQMSTINKSWLLLFVLNLNIYFKLQKCIFASICDHTILLTVSR